jgi:hypothetical protein
MAAANRVRRLSIATLEPTFLTPHNTGIVAIVTRKNQAPGVLVLSGNVFGLLAPIVTGYLVEASRSFSSAFIAAGVLALTGAMVTLVLSRGTIGGHLECYCPEPVARG